MAEKDSVRLRTRLLKNGNKSIYLDIYRDGNREYEFLKLYLMPEKTKADKDKNKRTLQLAEAIKSKRIIAIQNNEFGFKNSFKEDTLFFDFYEIMCERRLGVESQSNWGNWKSALKHLRQYCPNKNLRFSDVTPSWIEGFKEFLDKKATCWTGHKGLTHSSIRLSKNSKQSYFNKLKACLNQAYEERIIAINPMRGITGFKGEEGHRLYLTLEELKKMASYECKHPPIKQAFLFSCLTGLRRSDIQKMVWSEVQVQGEFTRIVFRQKKTGGVEYLDISAQASALLGQRKKADDLVFPDLFSPGATNIALKLWASSAGVDKDLTFHCGRHTFATLMLDLGTDIYTVSKLLGHRDISTTQIYAKVMDKKKQEAVTLIPGIMSVDEDSDKE